MCGINGTLENSKDAVERMNAATKHRGPDKSGVATFNSLSVGNNRLEIIGLGEGGNQPMTSADGNCTIVFNGEIYNYRELREEMTKENISFRGHSDTEVILEGYARSGKTFFSKLRGMWAIAVFDRNKNTLLLSRDPFGIKPLYLYDDGKTTAFSSEIRGILAHPNINKEMDEDAVRDLFTVGHILAPRTILKNARALLPGENILIDLDKKTRESEITRLPYAENGREPTQAGLETVIEDSVRAHLIAEVPVGLFFSGGIDSTIIAHFLKKLGVPMRAYHLSVDSRDDSHYAESIAKLMGLSFVSSSIETNPKQNIELLAKHMDQPTADSSFLPTLSISARAAEDVKVVLSGEGGDEFFAGYHYYRHARELSNISKEQPALAKMFSSVSDILPASISMHPRAKSAGKGISRLTGDPIGLYISERSITQNFGEPKMIRATIENRLKNRETPDGFLALDRLIFLPDDLLMKIDAATMAHSIEGRVPLTDKNVFSAVGVSPFAWKYGTDGKEPLKKILRGHLDPSFFERKKTGFSIPLYNYLFKGNELLISQAAEFYLKNFPNLSPAFSSLIKKKLHDGKFSEFIKEAPYVSYAILTLFLFAEKNQLGI